MNLRTVNKRRRRIQMRDAMIQYYSYNKGKEYRHYRRGRVIIEYIRCKSCNGEFAKAWAVNNTCPSCY